ncbi:MAG: hypothetical protein JXB32_20995 [Deltaproteobacteria bacterium]|nr:hypothetical protein [Deltaproteobacteria bacterium]
MSGSDRAPPGDSSHEPEARAPDPRLRLRLGQLPAGQVRAVDLPLVETRGHQRNPTGFYLGLKIACDVPGRLYTVDVKPDFGRTVPPVATLTVMRSRYEATRPVTLVEAGAPVERSMLLELDDGTNHVVFWIRTEGAAGVPRRMAAAIGVQPLPRSDEAEDDLDTMRLPTVRQAAKEELALALRQTPHPALSTLGELLGSDDDARKIEYLERLIAAEADICLIEAAVRDLDLCEQTVPGFAPTDFAALCLSDPVDASIAVFHPGSSPYLVHRSLTVALDRRRDRLPPGQARLWPALVAAAVVNLHRRAPELLRETLEDLETLGDDETLAFVRRLADRAAARPRSAPPDPDDPTDECLRLVGAADRRNAETAALRLLTRYGFVWVTEPA